MSKLTCTTLILIFALSATAQIPVLQWAKTFDSNNQSNYTLNNNGRTIGVDAQGNVYSAGFFQYSIDADPGPGVYSLVAGSSYNTAIFISKLDASGNFVWAGQIPTLVEWGQIEMEVDPAGNIYLASELRNVSDMDPGPGVFMMNPTNSFRDAFVVKINTNGNLVWAKQFGGPGDTGPTSTTIDFDQNGNVIICGIFNNTVDFDPGPGIFNLTSSAHMQAFIVKLNSNGELVWAKQFGNGPEVYSGSTINDMKCDAQGNIVVIGGFARTVDFDPGPGVYTAVCTAGSVQDGFIVKLDADCNLIWAKTIGQTAGDNSYITQTGFDIDGYNNVVVTGFFVGNFDFDPGPGVYNVNATFDCYILKLNQQGDFLFLKMIGGTGQDIGTDVVIDDANNIYTAGSFSAVVDFDPGPGVHIINSPHYGPSAIVKLSPAGNFVYAATFPSISYGTSLFRRMVMDPAKNIYVAGSVSGVNDFDPGPGVYPVAGHSNSAPFVLKLGRCLNVTSSNLDISACNSYTLNSQTFSSSGTYVQTIPNSTGCDSVITLRLTLNKKATEQSKTICNGESFFAGGRDQSVSGTYYDTLQTVMGCDSIITTRLVVNPKPSPDLGIDKSLCKNTQLTLSPGTFSSYQWQDNSTGANFTVNAAGTYWVTVTNNFNCEASDTFKLVSVFDLPSDFLKSSDSICSYSSLQLVPSRNYNNYHWSTGATDKNIQIHAPGIYHLTVTDANGCTGVDSTIVYPKQCMLGVYIPSAFTPNKDGRNDLFIPQIFGVLKKYQLTVYNRWGAIIFQTTDPDKGWDGRVSGIPQDSGVFIWTCTYQLEGMEGKSEKGTVTIVR